MLLTIITDETCPLCGAKTVCDSCTHTHTNGDGFEERTFECGCKLKWNPNFKRLEMPQLCEHSKILSALREGRNKLRSEILEVIRSSTADREFRDRLIEHYEFRQER